MFIVEMAVAKRKDHEPFIGTTPHKAGLCSHHCSVTLECSTMIIDQYVGEHACPFILFTYANAEPLQPIVKYARLYVECWFLLGHIPQEGMEAQVGKRKHIV